MNVRRLAAIAMLIGLGIGLGCGTSRPGGSHLYDSSRADGPLLDSEMKIMTFRSPRARSHAEERVVSCRGGKITAVVKKPSLEGSCEISLDDYARIWKALDDGKAMELKVEPIDTDGGPYHLVHLTLGKATNEFSAQFRTALFGFSVQEVEDRVEIINKISKILASAVPLQPVPEKPASGPTSLPAK